MRVFEIGQTHFECSIPLCSTKTKKGRQTPSFCVADSCTPFGRLESGKYELVSACEQDEEQYEQCAQNDEYNLVICLREDRAAFFSSLDDVDDYTWQIHESTYQDVREGGSVQHPDSVDGTDDCCDPGPHFAAAGQSCSQLAVA